MFILFFILLYYEILIIHCLIYWIFRFIFFIRFLCLEMLLLFNQNRASINLLVDNRFYWKQLDTWMSQVEVLSRINSASDFMFVPLRVFDIFQVFGSFIIDFIARVFFLHQMPNKKQFLLFCSFFKESIDRSWLFSIFSV